MRLSALQGDSMAQLMFKIANDRHVEILTRKNDLPQCLVDIIDKALAKEADMRYQTGAEMAEAIRACMASAGATPAAQSDVVDIGL
jgi:serine/threonine-protein kinase